MALPRARKPADSINAAVEVFVEGFGFTRNLTHPYVSERVGQVWALRDAPRKRAQDYRREEWISVDASPARVDRLARHGARGHFAIGALFSPATDIPAACAAYKQLGYRLGFTEPLMVHSLQRIPRAASPATVRRVATPDDADRLAKAAGRRQLLPEHLAPDTRLRAYVAEVEGEFVGWVSSIRGARGNWCANMFVQPKHRRQGIASALLAHMLRDDRSGGATSAVLLASHTGAKLYTTVGYEQIGTLYLFTPRRPR